MTKRKSAGKSLSSWWASETHRAMKGANAKAARLALAIIPVRSVIRVIDDSVPPLSVEWAEETKDDKDKRFSMSYTDFKGRRIAINPLPVSEGKLNTADAIDVVTGFAMHEASHSQHSRDRFDALVTTDAKGKEQPVFTPLRVAQYLLNVVEDVRIEAMTTERWPGFASYFDRVLDYMWSGRKPDKPGPDLVSQLQTMFLACRYPGRVAGVLTDPAFAPEIEWWQAWQSDYLMEKVDTPTTIQRGLDHLAQQEETQEEMQKMAAEEKAAQEAGEKLREMLKRLTKEGIEGVEGYCITEDGELQPLDSETAAAVRQLVAEQLVEDSPVITHQGGRCPVVRVTKPTESSESKRSYIGRPTGAVEAIRAAMVFRPEAPQHDVKLLRSGEMQDEELYRWGMRDFRVFGERIIETKPDVLMGLLVDLSGSMYGEKLRTAQELAQIFVWAIHDQDGAETRVWGHTGDNTVDGSEVFRIWEPGDPLSRLGLIATLPHSNNYDGHAIAYCVNQMKDERQPQKVLIVLSDGLPSGSGYGGSQAHQHMRTVCGWARRNGVEVIQVAIDDSLRPHDQSAMFGEGNWIGYRSTAELPRQMTKLMMRFT